MNYKPVIFHDRKNKFPLLPLADVRIREAGSCLPHRCVNSVCTYERKV